MQDSENHIIHIYGFDEKLSMNENDLTLHLQKALQPLVDNLPEIKIRGRSDRIWAYISVSAQQGTFCFMQPQNLRNSKKSMWVALKPR